MAGKKQEITPKRDFVNIGAFSVNKFPIFCSKCQTTTMVHDGRPTMVLSCSNPRCDKEFDLVYWRGVTDPGELQAYMSGVMEAAPSLSFDWETTGVDPYTCEIVGVSFCREDQPNVAIYVPLGHAVGNNMDMNTCAEICKPVLVSKPMNAHYMPFEWSWARVKWGVELRVGVDSMIEAYLDDANRVHRYDPRSLKLKGLAREIWDLNVTELSDLVDLKTSNFAYVNIKTAIPYGCQDSDLTTRLKLLWTQKNQDEQPLMHQLEHDLIPVICRMQLRGIQLNGRIIADGATVIDKEIERLQRQTFELMGFDVPPEGEYWEPPFDLGSSARVAEQFYLHMNLPHDQTYVGKPTKQFPKGQPSVGKDALENLRDEYKVMDVYLQYKEAVHMRDNFITTLPNYVNPITGYIHGTIRGQGAPTNRCAHSDPNLAQIPKRRE